MTTVRLENWAVRSVPYLAPELGCKMLTGNAYGHPDFPDGDPIATSPIREVCGEVVITESGRAYCLGEVLKEYEEKFPGARERLLRNQ